MRAKSTRRALKYRRGKGEIIIVNHDGRGWWDATSDAKGDVFTLVRHLEPSLSFGQVCQMLRRFVGVVPSFPATNPGHAGRNPAPVRLNAGPGGPPFSAATQPGRIWRRSGGSLKPSWPWPHARTRSAAVRMAALGSRTGATAR